jgi:cellulase/cellobiase CelA1
VLASGCNWSNDESVTLEYSKNAITKNGVTSSLSIDDDWGNGFCGAISIVNKSPRSVLHWQLELTRHGSEVGRQWGGLKVLPEDRLVVHPTGHNHQIAVGGTVSVPFCGSGSGRPSLRSMQVDILDGQG